MREEQRIFVNFLKENKLKLTIQRRHILDTFLDHEKHLSAEELYKIVKRKDPKIGQATVFRTLKLLCYAGIAREVILDDMIVRYEHKYGHEHHDHLVCVECSKCIETLDPKIEKLQEALCKKFSFSPQNHKMEIFGICKVCSAKKRN